MVPSHAVLQQQVGMQQIPAGRLVDSDTVLESFDSVVELTHASPVCCPHVDVLQRQELVRAQRTAAYHS